MDLLCLLGLKCCNFFTDYTKQVGQLLSWQNLLQIGGIIFAAVQFMETVKIRNYIFKFGWLFKATAALVGFAVISVVIANFIQLTGTRIALLSYPAFYELLALVSLSILLLFYVVFLLRPQYFLSFNPDLLDKISREIIYNQDEENLSALVRIISNYLEEIIKSASRAERPIFRRDGVEPNAGDVKALHFIDVDMSTPNFVKYVAKNNIGFILRFIELAEKYELWNAGGGIFVDRLTEALFTNEDSLLTRELMFGGVSGLQQPITNSLFRSDGLMSHYRVLNVTGHWSSEISRTVLNNWTHGLEVALRHYFSKERNIYYPDTPNDALSYSIERLGECARSIIYKLNKYSHDEIWDNEYGSKLSIIANFFERLVHVLVQDDAASDEKPIFSGQELKAEDRTVTLGIANGLFAYLEGFATMKDEEYSRMLAIEPYWVVFDGHSTPVLKVIRLKVLKLIKERFKENYRNRYASMVRLMLYIYDGSLLSDRSGNEIMEYVSNRFKKGIAKRILKDKKFREKHMPAHWYISKDRKRIYRKLYGRSELMYPFKTSSKTS